MTKKYIMKAYKYDNKLHYEQPLYLLKKSDNYIALKGEIGRKLIHYTRDAVYTFDKKTIEYFFKDRWYTASFIINKEGICDYIYCNICFPSKIMKNEVTFIDLDIDIIYEKGNIRVVDIDEFEEHKIKYKYPSNIINKVNETVQVLKKNINTKKHPFNLYI